LPKGKKEPLHSIQSGSKVAHYIQLVQKTIFIVEMCQNVPEEIRIREKNFVRKAGRIKKASRR
jgi:hypothetical protein